MEISQEDMLQLFTDMMEQVHDPLVKQYREQLAENVFDADNSFLVIADYLISMGCKSRH